MAAGKIVYKAIDELVDLTKKLRAAGMSDTDTKQLLQTSQGVDPKLTEAALKKAKDQQKVTAGSKKLEAPKQDRGELQSRPGSEAGFDMKTNLPAVQNPDTRFSPSNIQNRLGKGLVERVDPRADFVLKDHPTAGLISRQDPKVATGESLVKKLQTGAVGSQPGFGKFERRVDQSKWDQIRKGALKKADDRDATEAQIQTFRKEQADRSGDVLSNPAARELNRQRLFQEKALAEARLRGFNKTELTPEIKEIIPEGYTAKRSPRGWKLVKALGKVGAGLGTGLTASTIGGVPKEPELEPKPTEPKPTPITPVVKETKETKTEKIEPINIQRIILPESAADKELTQQLQSALDKFGKIKDPDVTPGAKREEMIKDLKALKADKESKLGWARLAERFLSAATKYAAAKRGQDLGLNLSRVEIERTDWDKMIDRAYDNYKTEYADMVKGFEGEDKAKALTDEQRSDILKRSMNMRGRIAELRDAKAQAQARLDQRYQDMLQKAKEKREDRVAKQEALSVREDKPTLPSRFLEERVAAETNIRKLIQDGASRKDIKEAITKDRLKLSPGFRNSLQELGMGPGPDFKIEEAQTAQSAANKSILSKQYSPSRNQTRITYADGTQEIVDGKQ